jgi:D-glycero-alpha-D-manno-heptose-7-phosphate kinase
VPYGIAIQGDPVAITNGTALRSRAPIRLDLAGGWTDVPPFSTREGGAVVNVTVNRYTYATLVPVESETIRITSADFQRYLEVRSFRDLEYDGNLDLIKAAIQRLGVRHGMELFVRCDAPPGSGTGSSASISVALIGLLNRLQDEKLSSHEIARLACLLEQEELNIAGGKQDQYAAALGGFNFMEFHDPSVSVSQLRVSDAVAAELEKRLVLCYTGRSRLSGNLIATVMDNYEAGRPETLGALRTMRGLAVDLKTMLLTGALDRFGDVLRENWACQRALDPSITNQTIEGLFEVAIGNGSIGGKALGAGGGGCLLFYSRADEEHVLRKALEDHGIQVIDFNFDSQGLLTWQA